jgi:hypothetical protein
METKEKSAVDEFVGEMKKTGGKRKFVMRRIQVTVTDEAANWLEMQCNGVDPSVSAVARRIIQQAYDAYYSRSQ